MLQRTDHHEPSVFLPENMLRETRRQWNLESGSVPDICLLDPDGDTVRHLGRLDQATRSQSWACYHSELWMTTFDGLEIGIVGCAVGAPFAVLVAEQLFASGCQFLVSITSAGQIDMDLPPSAVILIDRALRGDGTSIAYLPASLSANADPDLISAVETGLNRAAISIRRGATWTTDAPYRETESALAIARERGALAVEMEAAGLYAFAAARNRPVVCFAHVTNTMAVTDLDFEKGPADGVDQALSLVAEAARGWKERFA